MLTPCVRDSGMRNFHELSHMPHKMIPSSLPLLMCTVLLCMPRYRAFFFLSLFRARHCYINSILHIYVYPYTGDIIFSTYYTPLHSHLSLPLRTVQAQSVARPRPLLVRKWRTDMAITASL